MAATDSADRSGTKAVREEVTVPPHGLGGFLTVPQNVFGLVLFAHGSGSSRFSPRNTMVADTLNTCGLATLLFDLLGANESRDRHAVFDIPVLAERLVEATAWAQRWSRLSDLPVGYFGASTGAAAALEAAARSKGKIAAVVSRGGRPDLVDEETLHAVRAPTLLIVGGADHQVLALNQQVLAHLKCAAKLEIIPHATHLFEEPGALEKAADIAAIWFTRFMRAEAKASHAS